MSLADFRVLESLGKGAFATVVKVVRKSENDVYALKRVKIAKMSKREIADTLNEVRFLASITHKNIVGFLEAFLENNETELCIVMEYCGNGDLAAKVQRYKAKRQYMEPQEVWASLTQLLDALACLHSKGIMHRDIKCANVFLGEDGTVKLGDMNVSKRIKHGHLQTQIGTPYYMSPEIWSNKPYDCASDIWAVGCLTYELCALRPPFLGDSFASLKRAIMSGRYPPVPRKFDSSISNVIALMLQMNPTDRPTATALLEMPEVVPHKGDIDTVSHDHTSNTLLQTIEVPQNLRRLSLNLPKPKYANRRGLNAIVEDGVEDVPPDSARRYHSDPILPPVGAPRQSFAMSQRAKLRRQSAQKVAPESAALVQQHVPAQVTAAPGNVVIGGRRMSAASRASAQAQVYGNYNGVVNKPAFATPAAQNAPIAVPESGAASAVKKPYKGILGRFW